MDLKDFKEPEVAVTAAATATIFSPTVRKLLHKGAVYGVAGALIASDAVAAAGRGALRGFKTATGSNGGPAGGGEEETAPRADQTDSPEEPR